MKYMPFVGEITGRPSVLEGSIDNMIAQAKEVNDGIGIDVAATLVNKKELVANVMDAYNVVEIDNDYVENVIYYGKGAGRYVTASAVVSDIIKTAQTEKWQHNY